jgi:hypothetical protein
VYGVHVAVSLASVSGMSNQVLRVIYDQLYLYVYSMRHQILK